MFDSLPDFLNKDESSDRRCVEEPAAGVVVRLAAEAGFVNPPAAAVLLLVLEVAELELELERPPASGAEAEGPSAWLAVLLFPMG